MSINRLDVQVSEHYLRSIAPYTDGNQAFTDAFNGAADLIAQQNKTIEDQQARLDALTEALEEIANNHCAGIMWSRVRARKALLEEEK